jgi:ATPase subunit of ABC transporter with duplicated ATPase domains
MASLGLLGALGGVGQAMTIIGTDMVRRREKALDWLREDAEYQRRRADKQDDDAVTREHQSALIDQRSAAQRERDERVAAARREEKVEERSWKDADREDKQQSEREIKAAEIRARRDLERLKASLGETAKEKELKATLNRAKGVQYGPPDKEGKSELLYITNGGELKSTGKKVLLPQSFRTDLEEEDKGL